MKSFWEIKEIRDPEVISLLFSLRLIIIENGVSNEDSDRERVKMSYSYKCFKQNIILLPYHVMSNDSTERLSLTKNPEVVGSKHKQLRRFLKCQI